ncbi:MAG: hypothetical protein JSS05_08915 [Proteobacteria bacterium]|nr:hypothetical protein [Pseudomonadota bacterium]
MLHKALFVAVAAATVALAAPTPAAAVGRIADVTVFDRDTGRTLPIYTYRGEYWVAGRPGAKYAISVRNLGPGRILAVTSVDGVNVVSGQTAGINQPGYVFDGYQSYQIAGWRKSNAQIAAFEFVASGASYAERTGRPANVGVIGVAVFRELVRPPLPVEPQVYPGSPYGGGKAQADGARSAPSAAVPAPAPAESSAPMSEPPAAASARSANREKLGTGHGEREWSSATTTDFERARSSPNEVISIRYDSYDNLVAMGIVPAPRPPWPRSPNPFPSDNGYVPDPPPRHRW